ncbi:MAG: YfhO family protein [Clostridium sp.]|jgi:uncharacterized membrane protein YfhO|nr:YfhO family protein [Clostridium sp.]
MANTYLSKRSGTGKRILQSFTENAWCWLAFFGAAALMVVLYWCYEVIPFGDGGYSVLRMDLYHQYGPLLAELYDRIVGVKSFFYSWTSGMGGGFLGNFFNYVCSPLNLVTLLLGRDRIVESISLVILLNAACSAAAFTYYLKRSKDAHGPASAAFGILYAFCGWFIAYYWNIMWLDAMSLLPLVALGVEQIIRERKSGWLLFSLSMTFLTSYYMGYMVSLFAVVYFLCYYFAGNRLTDTINPELPRYPTSVGVSYTKPEDKILQNRFLRTGIRFALTGLASAGLVAFALLPVYYTLQSSSATGDASPATTEYYNNIFDFLANHLASLEPTIRSSPANPLPNVYSGMAALLLVPLFLFSKKITGRDKLMNVLLLVFLFMGTNVNKLNFLWHGFHFPNDLPYRFSFIYSFVLLVIAFRAFRNIREFSKAQICGVGVGVVLWIVLVQQLGSKNLTDDTIWISLAFAFIYTVCFGLMQNKGGVAPRTRKRVLSALLICIVCAEVAVASIDHFEISQKKEWFAGDRDAFVALKEQLDEREGNNDYRMELSYNRARMDPCWFGYNGISTFSSMAYEKTANLEKRLGLHSNLINSYTYYPQTPVYNAMHALRYLVVNNAGIGRPVPNEEYFQVVADSDKFHAYENLYDLPIAFGTDIALEDWQPMEDYNPFSVQSEWFRLATGKDGVFEELELDDMSFSNIEDIPFEADSTSFSYYKQTADYSGTITLYFTPKKEQNLYIYAKSSELDSMTVTGGDISLDYRFDEEYVLDLGVCKAGEQIRVELTVPDGADKQSGGFTLRCCALNDDIFKAGYEILNKAALNITEFNDTELSGTITMGSNGLLFTSIPYDKGWHITVDGEAVEPQSLSGALLVVPLSKGEHTITMRYLPQGLLAGILITLLTAASLLAALFIQRSLKRRAEKRSRLAAPTLALPMPTPKAYLDEMLLDGGAALPPLQDVFTPPELDELNIDGASGE